VHSSTARRTFPKKRDACHKVGANFFFKRKKRKERRGENSSLLVDIVVFFCFSRMVATLSLKLAKVAISNEEVPGSTPGQSYSCHAFCR
jgi:hypothetical protein